MAQIFTIVVTYNGEEWIERCLSQLVNSSTPTKVIVIDNASDDRTAEIVESFGERIHSFKRNKENLGFGQANNLGIEDALHQGAEFVFLLNQDAYIFPEAIGLLVQALKENHDFGILSPLQFETRGKEIEPIFKNFLKNNFSDDTIDNFMRSQNDFDLANPLPMRFVNAAAWMMSRECINRTGLFHPVFFHYGEDNHYASRAQYHKMKIGVLPSARVIHDCKKETRDSHKLLQRQMKNVPIYTLLDLRKPFVIAFLLGLQKWNRIQNKLKKYNDIHDLKIISDQRRWFFKDLKHAKQIRKKTKQVWNPAELT